MHPGDDGVEKDFGEEKVTIGPSTRSTLSRVLLSATPQLDPTVEAMITNLYHRYIEHLALYVAKGIIDKRGDNLVCSGIDGIDYIVSSWGEIAAHIRANPRLVEKVGQGFTDVLPIPFGCELRVKAERFRKVMQAHDRYRERPDQLIEPHLGVFNDHSDNLVYFPKNLNTNDHGGRTKKQRLDDPNNAWQIVLVNNQDQAGPGVYVGESVQDVLDSIQQDPARKDEIIMDADTYLTFAAALWARNIAVDDLNADRTKGKLTLCASTLLTPEGKIPGMGWNHIQRKPAVVPHAPSTKNDFRVVRTYVPIYPRHY